MNNGFIGRKCPNEYIITKKFKDAVPTKHFAFRFVTIDGSQGEEYVKEAQEGDYILGITLEDVFTTETELEKSVSIQISGIGIAEAKSDIPLFSKIEATANGLAKANSAPVFLAGYSLQNATATQNFVFEFNKGV